MIIINHFLNEIQFTVFVLWVLMTADVLLVNVDCMSLTIIAKIEWCVNLSRSCVHWWTDLVPVHHRVACWFFRFSLSLSQCLSQSCVHQWTDLVPVHHRVACWFFHFFFSLPQCLFLFGGGMEVGVEVRLFNHSEITQLSTGNLEWMMWWGAMQMSGVRF